jgi:hypothetical protein
MRATPDTLIAEFRQCTGEFRAQVLDVEEARWAVPRTAGKWSPAEEVEHVILALELFLDQLRGGPAMRVITTGWRRGALRWLVLPWILRTGRFPKGAKSPRESRPTGERSRERLLQRLSGAEAGLGEVIATGAQVERLTHPYFGALTVEQVLLLTVVHTRHHARSLARTGPTSAA